MLLHPAGRVLGNSLCDNPPVFYFYNHFAGQCWREGSAPLWNPWIMLGMPFLGEGQAAVFHPLSALFIFLPTGAALNWLIALSFLLTGLFFYGYLRALALGREAALFGALTWSFSSAMISRIYAGHISILLSLISIPLVLMLWERYRAARRVGWLGGIALAYGAMILGGHPQTLYIFSLFFGVYVLAQAVQGCGGRSETLGVARAVALLGLFIVIGIGLGAIQLLPSADFARESFRQKSSLEYAGAFSFAPENFLTLLCPRFFGSTNGVGSADQYWGRNYLWEMWIYIGILPLVLAVTGSLAAPRRMRIALLVCAAIFLVFGLGAHTPLFPLLYHALPFFGKFRGSAKFMLMAQLCLTVLGAYGMDDWLRRAGAPAPATPPPATQKGKGKGKPAHGGGWVDAGPFRYWITLATAVALLALVAGLYLYAMPGRDRVGSNWHGLIAWVYARGETYMKPIDFGTTRVLEETGRRAGGQLLRAGVFLVLALAWLVAARRGIRRRGVIFSLALVLLLADLLGLFLPYLVTYDESITRYPEEILQALRRTPYPNAPARVLDTAGISNMNMRHGFSTVGGYAGNTLLRYNDFMSYAQGLDPGQSLSASPIRKLAPPMRFLAVDYWLAKEGGALRDMTPLARSGPLLVYAFPEQFPRVFLAEAPRAVAGMDEALRAVLSEDADPRRRPVVEGADDLPAAAPVEERETASFVAFAPNRVELRVHASRPRLLVLNEMYEKGWTARVGGRVARVYPANFLSRAVAVPAGDSTVVFEYRPVSFRRGVMVSGGTLAGLLLAGAATVARRRRKKIF